jgi:hypothetical protein
VDVKSVCKAEHWSHLDNAAVLLKCDQTFWLMKQHYLAVVNRGNDQLLYSTLGVVEDTTTTTTKQGTTCITRADVEAISSFKPTPQPKVQKRGRSDRSDDDNGGGNNAGDRSGEGPDKSSTNEEAKGTSCEYRSGNAVQTMNATSRLVSAVQEGSRGSDAVGGFAEGSDATIDQLPELTHEVKSSSSWDTIALHNNSGVDDDAVRIRTTEALDEDDSENMKAFLLRTKDVEGDEERKDEG